MPFFYRRPDGKAPSYSRTGMRVATSVALLAYPLGCALQILWPDTTPEPGLTFGEIGGLGLVVVALGAFCFIAPSWFQRIVGEQTQHLDEFELELRRRAYAFSYQVFAGLVALFAIYMALAADRDGSGFVTLWTPSTYDHWNALFWGAMLYAFVLPTAWLSWAGPARLDLAEEDAAA